MKIPNQVQNFIKYCIISAINLHVQKVNNSPQKHGIKPVSIRYSLHNMRLGGAYCDKETQLLYQGKYVYIHSKIFWILN
jgi:hypothetical protein